MVGGGDLASWQCTSRPLIMQPFFKVKILILCSQIFVTTWLNDGDGGGNLRPDGHRQDCPARAYFLLAGEYAEAGARWAA